MDFSLTQEQKMLKDSVARFMRDGYSFDDYRAALQTAAQMKDGAWQAMVDMGWTALPFAEELGGAGLGAVELLSLAEELGRGQSIEPYLANVVLAGGALAGMHDEAGNRLLTAMIEGRTQLALAVYEKEGRYNPFHCATSAAESAGGWQLTGTKTTVLNGPNAGQLLVVARLSGEPGDASGLGLFRVDRDAAGLSSTGYALLGGGVAADLVLQNTPAERIGGEAAVTLRRVIDTAIAFTSADAYGVMQALLARTLEYLKTRKQFGVHLATFQVLQHRMVDMFIECEQSRSMVLMTMIRLQEGDLRESAYAAAACKAYIHKASRFVGQQAIQLHGGIGLTEELDIGHYFRRLTAYGTLFGDRRYQLQRITELEQAQQAGEARDRAAA